MIDALADYPHPLRSERFSHRDFAVELVLPESPDELIDVTQFNVDERLPYWADLWPSARALARHLLEAPELPSAAIELGCGVGLPSLALRSRGVDVIATDWYADARLFARANAERNGLAPLRTQELDWRDEETLDDRFPLIVAADVVYEERNVEPLIATIDSLLGPQGEVLIADPGRVYLPGFLAGMKKAGWVVEKVETRLESSSEDGDTDAGDAAKSEIEIYRFRRALV